MSVLTNGNVWIRKENRTFAVGLMEQSMSGDVVYVELPDVGRYVRRDEACASVEMTKAVAMISAPMSGEVSDINEAVFDDPDMIGASPMDTWLFRIKPDGEVNTDGWTSIE